jgi:hypothetical protein
MTKESQDGRIFHATYGAEIKGWVECVIWWCIVKTLSFEHFYKLHLDFSRVRKWFPNLGRWYNMQRFFKISDPKQDGANYHDKLFKVKEPFEYSHLEF